MYVKKKLYSLQFLRVYAAWLVLFSHYKVTFKDEKILQFSHYLFTISGNFGVELFFSISGFVIYYNITQKGETYKYFIQHRLVKIVPPYWFSTILFLIANTIFNPLFTTHNWNIEFLLKSLFFIPSWQPNGSGLFPLLPVGWSLEVEMYFYSVVALFLFFSRKHVFIYAILFLIGMEQFINTNNQSETLLYLLDSKNIYFFISGILVSYIYTRHFSLLLNYKTALTLLLLALLIYLINLFPYKPGITAILMTLMLLYETNIPQTKFTHFLLHLSNITYASYLIHPTIYLMTKELFQLYNITVIHFITLPLNIILIYIGSYLLYQYVERTSAKHFYQKTQNN